MSEENVELVKTWFERWNLGERVFGDDEVHAELEIASRLQSEPFRGPEGLEAWMREIDEQFDEWSLEPERWYERGDIVVVTGTIGLRGRESGVGFDQPAGWVIEIRDGRIYRLRAFVHPEDALRESGFAD
jgi:ketosteroid isomerase-like protein